MSLRLFKLAKCILFISLFIGLFFFRVPSTFATTIFIQGQANSLGSTSTTDTLTFTNVKAGDLLVGWFGQYNSTGQVTVSDNVNGAWTRAPGGSETFSSGSGDIALYYKVNTKAASSLIITASASTSTFLQMGAAEYTGVSPNTTLDQIAVAEKPLSANSTTVVAGPTASVNAGELVFGSEITGSSPTSATSGSGFTKRADSGNGSVAVEDIRSSTQGTQSSNFTLGTAADWYSVVATFNSPPVPTPAIPSTISGPSTSWHYAPNSNFDGQRNFVPGADGFNLSDANSISDVNDTPAGDKALVFIGLCNGADTSFKSTVQPYFDNQKVFAFYLMDDPDPTGQFNPLCTAANLKAESDWIHQNDSGTKTFIVLMNLGTTNNPSYTNSYTPSNSDIDYYGLDSYPCHSELRGCDNSIITKSILAAEASGVPQADVIPLYQAFGEGGFSDDLGGTYLLPDMSQTLDMLSTWGSLIPSPAFDYTYSWGSQRSDDALEGSSSLQYIFALFNAQRPTSTSQTQNGISINPPNPNMFTGWSKVIMAGPHFAGISQFITGDNADNSENVSAFIGSNATHDDLYITIKKDSLADLENPGNVIPFPWMQGYNTVSDIYNFAAVSSFNGYPDNQFYSPVTIILPYTKPLYNNNVYILEYNPSTHKWVPLTNSIVNPQTRTVAATTTYFSYFTVAYTK
jgi:hypothetical protein